MNISKILLKEEAAVLNAKEYNELSSREYPYVFERVINKDVYEIEVDLLELTKKYIHLAINVNKAKSIRSIFPYGTSIIIN